MPDSTSVRQILDAAEQAAAAGDLDAAGELLRQVVQFQEAELGLQHPDLANTLNNLGVVCEMTGRFDEAGACYRRAYDIAAASFEPDHPSVVTSRKNFVEFRETHGIVMEAAPVPPPEATAPPPAVSPITPTPMPAPTIKPATGHEGRRAAKTPAWGIGAAIAVIVMLALGAIVMRRPGTPDTIAPAETTPAAETPIVPAPQRDTVAGNEPAAPSNRGGASTEDAPPSAGRGKGSVQQPTVARAQLCRRFTPAGSPDWKCEQAGATAAPGTFVYYTRIKATSATTVEHRWYLGDELQQRVRLDVSANSDPGYRTFSRLTIGATGRWRVELRTTSGALLHEERFNVR
jgi:hypothetical protein